MDYKKTREVLANMQLWEQWPGIDDSHLERLMRIERGQLTGDEAVEELFDENEWKR